MMRIFCHIVKYCSTEKRMGPRPTKNLHPPKNDEEGVTRHASPTRRARGDAGGSHTGPYMSLAPIRDSRAIRRALSGPVVPKQGSDGNLSEPDMA